MKVPNLLILALMIHCCAFSQAQSGDPQPDAIYDKAVFRSAFEKAASIGSCLQLDTFQKISDLEGNFNGVLNDGDEFGISVDVVGDLDGNGVNDLIVGTPRDDDGIGTDLGAVWILYLDTDGQVISEQKISDSQGGFNGNLDDGDWFGSHVAGIGDINNDNIPDILVGTNNDDDGGFDQGAAYIIFLNPDGTAQGGQKISDTQGNFGGNLDPNDDFGTGVSGIGDLDGNGTNDVIVGAYNDDDGGTDRGAVYVLFLDNTGNVVNEQKISDTQGGFNGNLSDGSRFGFASAGIGDLDGDNVLDIAVAAFQSYSFAGSVFILFMNSNGTVKSHQEIASGIGGMPSGIIDGGDRFGRAIESISDINNDGVVDLAITAHRDDDGGTNRGALYIVCLNPDGTVLNYSKISDSQGNFSGILNDNDRWGTGVTFPGDIDNNGEGDVVVGSRLDDDGGMDRGAVWVLFFDNDDNQYTDTTICLGDSVRIRAREGVDWSWLPSTGLSQNNVRNPVISPGQDQEYVIEVVTADNCIFNDSLSVKVEECCSDYVIPTAFSPNEDGVNDIFRPLRIDQIAEFGRLMIWNRWGEMIFENSINSIGWDGTHKGIQQPIGSYVYAFTYGCDGNRKLIKGNVTLIR